MIGVNYHYRDATVDRLFSATSRRFWSALLLTVLYAGIALSPLAPFALKSARIAHAVTGECSGNCDIDGCPLESRINRTCCCWQKKHAADNHVIVAKNGCDDRVAQAPPEPKSDCCAVAPSQPTAARQVSSCCATVETATVEVTRQGDSQNRQTVFKCNPPCGKGKVLAFTGSGTMEIMPFLFAGSLPASTAGVLSADNPPQLSSRLTTPPDPPPKNV